MNILWFISSWSDLSARKACRNYFSQCGHKPWIGMIHQHFMLVPQLTVTDIILGTELGWQLNLFKKAEVTMSEAYDLEVNL
jgi:ABC-type uncharacterized transport system ATPase subunit